MSRVTLAEFRQLVRRIAQEQLAESIDDHSEEHGGKRVGDPRWDDHADPTGKEWDMGRDEEEVQLEPIDSDIPRFECNACGYSCPGHAHGDYQIEGTCPRCGHDNTADEDPNEIPEMQQFQEADDDHSEEHGGKRVGDPRWDDHTDPTGKDWDKGLG
jgi:hypothetical protein